MKAIISITTILAMTLAFSVSAEGNLAGEEATKSQENQSCGAIVLYNKPPSTRNMHFASIVSIDGHNISSTAQSFNLSPGKHILRVQEHITEESLTRRRGEAKNFHIIEFEVEANKKYSLGAKYIRKNRSKYKSGEYWTPSVWKTSNVECKV
ncbi:hypothetical protein [Colwellia sp. 12G3]|uniref:hypothetical protein n=1 Tax=Colwellia sp. 12G3 TaxID=2058299 RepID=UPI000C32CC01|nr:hypothetical protein [Colwellia sp. 12G3]PKI17094.1 hypothetical protein CXF71_07635 [Colwellia sp. 12G3]